MRAFGMLGIGQMGMGRAMNDDGYVIVSMKRETVLENGFTGRIYVGKEKSI